MKCMYQFYFNELIKKFYSSHKPSPPVHVLGRGTLASRRGVRQSLSWLCWIAEDSVLLEGHSGDFLHCWVCKWPVGKPVWQEAEGGLQRTVSEKLGRKTIRKSPLPPTWVSERARKWAHSPLSHDCSLVKFWCREPRQTVFTCLPCGHQEITSMCFQLLRLW
jgi:hypothetical protein